MLENWGLLWIWHSLAMFVLCLLTQVLAWRAWPTTRVPGALGRRPGAWGAIFWRLRRRAGPVLFVERQIAHAWAAGVCASIAMFVIELLMSLPVLTLSPVLAVAAGMVFVFKAGILSGRFYVTAAAMFLTAAVMALVPQVAQCCSARRRRWRSWSGDEVLPGAKAGPAGGTIGLPPPLTRFRTRLLRPPSNLYCKVPT